MTTNLLDPGSGPDTVPAAAEIEGEELLLVLSADREESLYALVSSCHAYLRNHGFESGGVRALVSAAGQLARSSWRLAVTARDVEELMVALEAVLAGRPHGGVSRGRVVGEVAPRIALVFSGQGSEWPAMGTALLESSPVFRRAIEACDQAMRPHFDGSLLQALRGGAGWSADIDVVQPCIFAMQVALAELWRTYGVVADAVVGHSIGEVAAAHVSGALTLEAAAEVICRQSKLFRAARGAGTLLYVELGTSEAASWLAAQPPALRGEVEIAIEHARSATVLAGTTAALTRLSLELDRSQTPWRWIAVDVPAHSAGLAESCEQLERALLDSGFAAAPARIPFYSARTGAPLGQEALDARYWRRASTEPVRLVTAVERMLADGFDTFVEVSPHPLVLSTLEELTAASAPRARTAVYSLRRRARPMGTLLGSLGGLFCHGLTPSLIQGPDPEPRLLAVAIEGLRRAAALAGHGPAQPRELAPGAPLAELLASARGRAARLEIMERHLRDDLAAVLEVPAAAVELDAPLRELGLDSMMAVRMRARLELTTGLRVAATVVWSYPTVRALAQHLTDALAPPEPPPSRATPEPDAELDRLTERELADLLLAEIHIVETRLGGAARR
jgi:acyl transferase domain-containing protein